jgi:6,7-dimethyl-8-ribityllumazine synthase
MTEHTGQLDATGLKVAVVVARFNQLITDKLLEGALDCFVRHGGVLPDADVVRVPGAFELPIAAKRLAAGGRYRAIVALGAVIRGGTPHFEYVCNTASSGLAAVALETGIPVGFGVITADTVEQALDRAGVKSGNKGWEAMLTSIEMANVLKLLG